MSFRQEFPRILKVYLRHLRQGKTKLIIRLSHPHKVWLKSNIIFGTFCCCHGLELDQILGRGVSGFCFSVHWLLSGLMGRVCMALNLTVSSRISSSPGCKIEILSIIFSTFSAPSRLQISFMIIQILNFDNFSWFGLSAIRFSAFLILLPSLQDQ